MRAIVLTLLLVAGSKVACSQTTGPCFNGSLDNYTFNVYLDADSTAGRLVVYKMQKDSSVFTFTASVKDKLLYPKFATKTIKVANGLYVTTTSWEFAPIVGEDALRLPIRAIKNGKTYDFTTPMTKHCN